ncbi:hypothetical protein ACLOJK_038928 [Asimina triloba]
MSDCGNSEKVRQIVLEFDVSFLGEYRDSEDDGAKEYEMKELTTPNNVVVSRYFVGNMFCQESRVAAAEEGVGSTSGITVDSIGLTLAAGPEACGKGNVVGGQYLRK